MLADVTTLVSIDGTDCPIEDPGGVEFYSDKLNGAGLRYEVAIDIERNAPLLSGRTVDFHVERIQILT